MSDQVCCCCGATDVPTQVRSSSIGPVSLQYCETCLEKGAEPAGLFEVLGIAPEAFNERALSILTFHEGEYKSLREYLKDTTRWG